MDDPEAELHPFNFPDDIRSVYRNEDMGDNEESLNDLLTSLGEHQAGPSRLGRGKGKDIKLYNSIHQKSPIIGDTDTAIEYEDDDNLKETSDAINKAESEDVGDDVHALLHKSLLHISCG